MFTRAIVATDLTAPSDCLVACVGDLATLGVKEVVLAHVIDVFAAEADSNLFSPEADTAFARQAAVLEAAGLRVHVDAPVGHPSFSLQQSAERHDADLIVVGSRRQPMLAAAFSGSVTSDLVQLTTRPILAAPADVVGDGGEACTLACRRMLGHILHPTDFSETAERAFRHVMDMVSLGAGRVTLAHVISPTRDGESDVLCGERVCRDDERLGELKRRLSEAGDAQVDFELRFGDPAEEVAALASDESVTCVVMGTRGRTRPVEDMLGGVAERVVRISMVPVLLVPALPPDGYGQARGTT